MPHLQHLIEVLSATLCECSGAALAKLAPFEATSLEVARGLHQRLLGVSPAEIRGMLRELVCTPAETVQLAIQDGIVHTKPVVPDVMRDTLAQYLDLLPEIVRQTLRRPGDPDGTAVPVNFTMSRAEDWLLFLPDRLPSFRPGYYPEQLDHWRVEALRGLGPTSEVWDGYDDEQPELSPACLKFVVDSKARHELPKFEALLRRVLDLDVVHGIIPLRSVYMQSPVPCLEYVHVSGYSLASVMNDVRWRHDRVRPEQAATIIRRLAKTVGRLHRLNPPLVHRGLKPSNVLLSPTVEGRVTLWLSDLGWGEITAATCTQTADPSHTIRRALRGSYCRRYASPQLLAGAPPDPRDDVYAIGMIWYQLLVGDPTARRPIDGAWAADFKRHGLSDGQAKLLMSCIADIPAERPGDGHVLADLITSTQSPIRNGDSGTISLAGSNGIDLKRPRGKESAPTLRIRQMPPDDLE